MLISLLWSCTSSVPAAAADLGKAAPDFTLPALDGSSHTLSSHRGKTVVLEWFNPGCPYIQDTHAAGGALDGLAAKAMADGVVWLAINSGAPGKEGADPAENKSAASEWKLPHPILMDPTGAVGHLYGAKTTPHMYVIDPAGTLVYRGAIDDHPLRKGDGTPTNFVAKALADLVAGRPVATADTRAYG